MSKKIYEILTDSPIVSAVKNDMFFKALDSPCKVIFLLNANILSVPEQIEKAHQKDKKVFVHIDLAEGIGKDSAGIEFLSKCGADGIISTKTGLIRAAKDKNLPTVQRIFALDSQGILSVVESVKNANPEFIEVMPGIAFKIIKRLSSMKIPIIAGGLIDTKSEVFSALDSGAVAVSTGNNDLWYM
ncbi:MAG: glycerol-3-phosphate responsive antiterminator [Clostridia bacterium]|nr:glycerol-3-phosphate responsive antiterminator [Clostridia bacterium]